MTPTALIAVSGLPRNEAAILLTAALEVSPVWLVTHANEALIERASDRACAWFERRRAGEPVAYVVGVREFYGLELRITPDVLIPRPETELLVDLVLEHRRGRAGHILDLATGSGAIAVAIAKNLDDASVWASDVSEPALLVARTNAERHGVAIGFLQSAWFAALDGKCFDVIVSNPPYVRCGDAHLEQGDLRFEPRVALDGGADGLQAIRSVIWGAPAHLNAGGALLVEHGFDQAQAVAALFVDAGFQDIRTDVDLQGHTRVTRGVAGTHSTRGMRGIRGVCLSPGALLEPHC